MPALCTAVVVLLLVDPRLARDAGFALSVAVGEGERGVWVHSRCSCPVAEGCKHAVVRPDPDTVIAENQSSLTDAFFDDPQANDPSKFFATRLELNCQG